MIRLSAEHGLKGPQMAAIVREREAMGRSWLKRYLAQGIEGLQDTPRSGRPAEITAVYRTALLAAGRLVLLDLPTYSPWLDPIEMWWRQFRRAVTHSEFCVSVAALVKVGALINQEPHVSARARPDAFLLRCSTTRRGRGSSH